MFTPPPGSQLAPWPYQTDLRVSADPMNVWNDPKEGPRPQAISSKKKWIRAKKRLSEILLPVWFSSLMFKFLWKTFLQVIKFQKVFFSLYLFFLCQIFPTKRTKMWTNLVKEKTEVSFDFVKRGCFGLAKQKNKNGLKSRGIALPNPFWWRLPLNFSIFAPLDLKCCCCCWSPS